MDKHNCNKSMTGFTLSLCFVALLSACGGGTSGVESEQPSNDAAVLDTGTSEFTPSLGENLSINSPQSDGSNDVFIGAQWEHMQTCLQVSAVEPMVTIVDEKITPTSSNDDVIRYIDSQILASSNVTDTGASIQIRSDDLDGSLGESGAYLRSIMGRYLWFANDLAERDYPHECANGS